MGDLYKWSILESTYKLASLNEDWALWGPNVSEIILYTQNNPYIWQFHAYFYHYLQACFITWMIRSQSNNCSYITRVNGTNIL